METWRGGLAEGLEKHKTFESTLLEWGCFGPIWKNETNFSRKQKLLEIPTGWEQISRPFIERSQGGGGGGLELFCDRFVETRAF